jgi:hypothetical protein
MTSKRLITCLTCLAILGTGLQIEMQSAIAVPAALFTPILNDIRASLPKGLQMRLPASIPASSIRLYPFIAKPKDGSFQVRIGTTPNCGTSSNSARCTVGAFVVVPIKNSQKWPPRGSTRLNLSRGIPGYYTGGASQFLAWQQDGLRFAIAAPPQIVSRQQLREIANSMINEPAITRN